MTAVAATSVFQFLLIALWGCLTSYISLYLYKIALPIKRIAALRRCRSHLHRRLQSAELNWNETRHLSLALARLSGTELRLITIPLVLSLVSFVIGFSLGLKIFGEFEYLAFGPKWIRDFEFWFFVSSTAFAATAKFLFGFV